MFLDRQVSGRKADGGRRKGDGDAATTTTEVLSPPDLFPSSRFPSDLVDCCLEIGWVFFCYLLKFLFLLVGVQNGSVLENLCFTSVGILVL